MVDRSERPARRRNRCRYPHTRGAADPLFAFVAFYRGQDKTFETPPLQAAEVLNNRIRTIPLKFDLLLAKLTPGKYQLRVTVVDTGSQKIAYWQSAVMLVQ